mgnify:CR=1 FL=1
MRAEPENAKDTMSKRILLTGDVNLLAVEDASLPFRARLLANRMACER